MVIYLSVYMNSPKEFVVYRCISEPYYSVLKVDYDCSPSIGKGGNLLW